ncbi:hypothetical protein QTP88_028436 [Uroleucon formosanum]
MNSIIVVTICAMFITFSEVDTKPHRIARNLNSPSLEFINNPCILMDSRNYSVRGMGLDSPPISGCVYFKTRDTTESVKKAFTLWFGNSYNNGRPQCDQEVTPLSDYSGIQLIMFPCVEHSSSLERTEDGTNYLRIYGVTINKEGEKSIRCALLEKDEVGSNNFRLAISGDDSCDGLSRILILNFPRIPKGSKLLQLTREP